MKTEAASAGFYKSLTWNKDYPRIQILTVEDLLAGKAVDYPPSAQVGRTFKKAKRQISKDGEQLSLGDNAE